MEIPKMETELFPKVSTECSRLEFKTIRLDAYTDYDKELFNEGNMQNKNYLSHFDTHVLNNFMQVYYFS